MPLLPSGWQQRILGGEILAPPGPADDPRATSLWGPTATAGGCRPAGRNNIVGSSAPARPRVQETLPRSRSGARLPALGTQKLMVLRMNEVTRILSAIEQGDSHAAEQLLPLVYD